MCFKSYDYPYLARMMRKIMKTTPANAQTPAIITPEEKAKMKNSQLLKSAFV